MIDMDAELVNFVASGPFGASIEEDFNAVQPLLQVFFYVFMYICGCVCGGRVWGGRGEVREGLRP